MDGQADLPATEFERALRGLEGLARNEIVALVVARVDHDNERAFAALTESLSLDTLRLLLARALLAASSHQRPTLKGWAPGWRPGKPAVGPNRPGE
jgi:hypothetical protein